MLKIYNNNCNNNNNDNNKENIDYVNDNIIK